MGIVFILIWILLFFYLIRKDINKIYSPLLWLFIGWGFVFGLYHFSGIDYSYKASMATVLYYWGLFVVFALSYLFACRFRVVIRKSTGSLFGELNTISLSTRKLYTFLAIAGCAIYILDIIRLNPLTANLHWEIQVSGIGNIGRLLAALGLLLWLYGCNKKIVNNEKLGFGDFACAGAYVLPGLITSGRQNIIIVILSTVVILIYSLRINPKYKYKSTFKFLVGVAFVVLMAYVLIISAQRTVVNNKIDLFNYMYKSSIDPQLEAIIRSTGPIGTLLMEILYYYSHELSMLEVLLRFGDGRAFILGGFTLVANNIPVGNGNTLYRIMYQYLTEVSNRAGVYDHVWRTAAGGLYVDFGIIGSFFAACIYGYLIGRFYKKCKLNQSPYRMVGISLVCAGMLFCMQFNCISEYGWVYPMFWWITLPLVEKVLLKPKRI